MSGAHQRGGMPLGTRARRSAKAFVGRHPLATVPALLGYNLWWRARFKLGRAETDINALPVGVAPVETADRAERIFNNVYWHHARPSRADAVAAELGPGGSAAVALLMRRYGCAQVDLIDRYAIHSDLAQERGVYAELSRRHGLEHLKMSDEWDRYSLAGIGWYEGESAEDYFAIRARQHPESYDFIGSQVVMQHLYDPLSALRHMVRCLRPGGSMVHAIDLRDQGFFSQGSHELTYLSIAGWLWPHLTRHIGGANRVLAHRYRALLENLRQPEGIDFSILAYQLVGVGGIGPAVPLDAIPAEALEQATRVVESRRATFAPEFRSVASRDLAVSGIVLVIKKA